MNYIIYIKTKNICHYLFTDQKYKYFTPLQRSGCCIRNGQKHQFCYCEKEISFCKLICDEDPHCKGYAGEGDEVCQISTASACPHGCEPFAEDQISSLDRNGYCGSGDGCFMKKSRNIFCL